MGYIPKELKKTADISRGRSSPRRIFEYTVGLIAFCVVAYLLLGGIGNVVARVMPDSWESRLSSIHFDKTPIESDQQEKLQHLLDTLLDGQETRDLDFQIHVIDLKEPNAFASPVGQIWVTKGIFDIVGNDAELAFVIAHELGHHHHRHVLKRLSRATLIRIFATLMFGTGNSNPGGAAVTLAELNYSRQQELEADRFAMDLMRLKFPNSPDAHLVLGKLSPNLKQIGIGSYLSTHPYAEERIRILEDSL